jgi:hypothetical protein
VVEDASVPAETTDWNPMVLCVSSQKGLVFDCPQRQSEILSRPERSNTFPSESLRMKFPLILRELFALQKISTGSPMRYSFRERFVSIILFVARSSCSKHDEEKESLFKSPLCSVRSWMARGDYRGVSQQTLHTPSFPLSRRTSLRTRGDTFAFLRRRENQSTL